MRRDDLDRAFAVALRLAVNAHHGQFDKRGMPYILHPLAVAERLDDREAQIVALLHDVIEDTPLSAHDLRREGIPESVIDAVNDLTRDPSEGYADFIERIANSSPLAIRVKLADLAENTRPDRRFDGDGELRKRYTLAMERLKLAALTGGAS